MPELQFVISVIIKLHNVRALQSRSETILMPGKTGWSQIDVLQAGATGCTDMGDISDLRLRRTI